MNRPVFQLTLMFAALLAVCQSGCTTLGSLGLPFGNSPDKLLRTTDQFLKEAVLPANMPSELSRRVLDSYILEPGDTVLIEAAEFDSVARFPGDQTIMLDGMISLGKYGQLQVSGKTLAMLQTEVQAIVDGYEQAKWNEERLAAESKLREEALRDLPTGQAGAVRDLPSSAVEDIERQLNLEVPRPEVGPISVRIVSLSSKAYYVLGQVNSPGRFVMNGQETVLDAILAAGGLTDQANRHKIILSRPSRPCDSRVVLPICYNHITQLGDTSTNYQIRPGDRIVVVGKSFFDDVMETICPKRNESCPACGPPQTRRCIPFLNCNFGDVVLPTTLHEEVAPPAPSPVTEQVIEESAAANG